MSPARLGLGRFRLNWITVAVVTVFAILAGAVSLVTARLEDDQELRLLQERANEINALLTQSVSTTLTGSFTTLGQAARGGAETFSQTTRAIVAASPMITGVALVSRDKTGWTVRQSAGKALTTGQRLSGERLRLVSRAGALLRSAIIHPTTKTRSLASVIGAPTAPAGSVLYQEFTLDSLTTARTTSNDAFNEVQVAVYAGTEPDAGNLLLSTARKLPLTGLVARTTMSVGADKWLVVTSPRTSLTGTLAEHLALILLIALLMVGLATGALTETILRRRDYAMSQVEARTAELRTSLEELAKTQQDLVASQRLAALGQMAATVGHELRNPLAVLTNSMYLIRHAVAASMTDRLARQLDTADREIAAATLIVSDLLEFSRPRQATPSTIDVGDLIREVVTVAPPPQNIQVHQQPDTMPPVIADRAQIRQVLLNLLTNAYDAMPNGGDVQIEAHQTNGSIQISVSDSGTGIDDETLAQAFEPFFTSKVKGVGLGLAVSRKIMESHSGSLSLGRRAEGGSVAVLELPLEAAPVGAPA